MADQQVPSLLPVAVRGAGWTGFGMLIMFLTQLAVLMILARLITPADFGIFTVALSLVNFFMIFAEVGVGPALVQRIQITPEHIATAFLVSSSAGAAFATLLIFAAGAIERLLELDGLSPVLQAMSAILLFKGASNVALFLLYRDLKFNVVALADAGAYVAGYGGVGLFLGLSGFQVWSLALAHLTYIGLSAVLLIWLRPHLRWRRWRLVAFGDLIRFGGGQTIARLFNQIALGADKLIVAWVLGGHAAGVFGRAVQLATMPASLFGSVANKVLFPTMSQIQEDPARLENAYRRGVSINALLVLPSSIFLFLAAPELIRVVLGSTWSAVVVPFQILCASLLFRSSYKLSDTLAQALGAVYRRAVVQVIYAFNVVAAALIGSAWGLTGVAVGTAIAITVNFVLMAWLTVRLGICGYESLARAHLRPFALAMAVNAASSIVLAICRKHGLADLSTLLVAGIVFLVTGLLLIFAWPRLFVGDDGLYVVGRLRSIIRHP